MDSQQPYRKPDLMKIIDKYIKKIDKSQKYDQYSYKSSKEEKFKQYVKSSIGELDASLSEMVKKAQEKANISKIKKANTLIDLKCLEFDDLSLSCKRYIDARLHIEENKVIMCYTGWGGSPYNFGCTHDGYEPLFYFEDPFSFIKRVESSILSAFSMLRFGKLLESYRLEYRVIHIKTDAFTNPDHPTKANPEMKIGKNSINFYNGRSYIQITFYFDVFNPSYLEYF